MRIQFKDMRLMALALCRLWTAVCLVAFASQALSQNEAVAAESCASIFASAVKVQDKAGALFLHGRDSQLHISAFVEKTVQQNQRVTGTKVSKPADKLNVWLEQLGRVADKAGTSTYAREQVKALIHQQYAMTVAEVPESYYTQQTQIARDRGHGNTVLNETQKSVLAQTVVMDQQQSLNLWVDYLVSNETQVYPMWLKYWMFTGMTKLSKFDAETGSFGNRSKETVAPFVEVNYEALAYVADAVVRKINKKSLTDISDPVFVKALDGMNFGKLYGQALYKLGVGRDGYFETNEGRWVLYPRDSDPMPMVKSLEGRNTGWCIAGESTARTYIRDGDFYIYYSRDKKGQNQVPRVAIRMQGDQIAEVRGVAKEQNLDAQIQSGSIVSDKIKTFGVRGEKFTRKDADMKMLTMIDKKVLLGQPLSKGEVVFVREFERPIEGFGWNKDPRIEEILAHRDLKEDVALYLDHVYSKDEIALSAAEFLNAGKTFKVLKGDITVTEEGQRLPELLLGNLNGEFIDSATGLKFPRKVSGDVVLNRITTANGVRLPEEIGGNLDLSNLKTSQGLHLPSVIKGSLKIPKSLMPK